MDNLIVIAVLVVVIGGAAIYVFKQRKKGVKCIGCPNGNDCSGNCCSCDSKK